MDGSVGSASGSVLSELIGIWRVACLENPVNRKDSLRAEARSFFASIVRSTEVVTSSNVKLTTTASHEEALATLIRDLEPAFTGRHVCRICALNCLCGAVEGCQSLSNKILKLLGKFLLGHCVPIEEDHDDEDYDESLEDSATRVRDAAILALTALLNRQLEGTADMAESLQLRLEFCKKGVENRVAVPAEDSAMDYDHGYGGAGFESVRGGLSNLPRSKRSLCFDLVQGTLDGMGTLSNGTIPRSDAPQLQPALASFATFTASCLHGEADPRCLMQLLKVIVTLLNNFEPLVKGDASFPVLDVFDAVAPYYPVNFTPPPNDVHGITRSGLHTALMAILCHPGYDLGKRDNQESLFNLSAGLMIERLIPEEGETGTVSAAVDRLEALEDISVLFFESSGSRCHQLSDGVLRQLSSSLFAVHEESSAAAAKGGEEGDKNKELADACRSLVAKVTYELEIATDKSAWETFVLDAIKLQSAGLLEPGMRGRTSIAYLACLCASGGAQTLRHCLDTCMDPLIQSVANASWNDELVTTAAYGIGAFFSSCRVALDKATELGVALQPHPLKPYSDKAFTAVYTIFDATQEELEQKKPPTEALSTQKATLRAFEAILLASTSDHYESSTELKIVKLVEALTNVAVAGDLSRRVGESVEGRTFLKACCETLGALLGTSLNPSTDSSGMKNVVVGSDAICDVLTKKCLPTLFSAARTTVLNEPLSLRLDHMVLALCCKSNVTAAASIVNSLVQFLKESLEANDQSVLNLSSALWFAFRYGGPLAIKSFHELSHPSATADDIFALLSNVEDTSGYSGDASLRRVSMSELYLPPTSEVHEALQFSIHRAYAVVKYLLPAYETTIPIDILGKMISLLLRLLPPISDQDTINVGITLPLLSAALQYCDGSELHSVKVDSTSETMNVRLSSLIPLLAAYSLRNDHDSFSRSAAASCLHSILRIVLLGKEDVCPASLVTKETLVPLLRSSLDSFFADEEGSLASLIDSFNVLAVVGSAAAYRGGRSLETADEITRFLVEVACSDQASVPFATGSDAVVALAKENNVDGSGSMKLALAAAASFGSMITNEGGSPFWKQRLTHISVKMLQKLNKKKNAQPGASGLVPSLGLVGVSCHIVCSTSFEKLGKADRLEIAEFVVQGLHSGAFHQPEPSRIGQEVASLEKLALAAVLKVCCVEPDLVSGNSTAVAKCLLQAYGLADETNGKTDVTNKLLALQGLGALAQFEKGKHSLGDIGPFVVSALGDAVTHPSLLVRRAAVDTRNMWLASI